MHEDAPLDRAAVIAGAVRLADRIGADALTMRRLADELGSAPMTLYGRVANKDDVLDGMVDAVFAEIDLPPVDLAWREAMAVRCRSARTVLGRHPWAVPLMESRRSPGAPTLEHHDAVLGCLLSGGLPMPVVAHAYAVLDAFVYGFAIQEATLPGGGAAEELDVVAEGMADVMTPEAYPHLTRFTVEHVLRPGYDFGSSFEIGLAMVLDGVEALTGN